ncbi:site-specific DNA-methyltransferase [Clostridium algidicarnis]|uniref:Adenine-specific DNA-methyltransferase n=1 Tax=Clostridium algidicarnis DSM 15099 TaxID=1121295 RepID=A0A2S6FUV0_9CLOT|nr:site-specific DNA-methyltransferase [Clostridium algidicarnis]PPK45002.1 adenine-specific DNA-methyltransferase [Clostridium algidicarnis DSM 15099]
MDYPKVPQEINNIVEDNVKLLAQIFPSAVKDGQVDFEALKEELGQFEEVDKEKYELTWAGKQDAKKKAQEDVYNRTLNYIESDSKNPETTENLYIEGDNLEVLKLLRQNYYGTIKMIYIDPPYNTDGDFVYNDKFKISVEESDILEGARDESGNALQKNSKSSNRFHANWLNMMYPRLRVAKDLLTDDGVIFISIDEHEYSNLKKVCDEIFDEANYFGDITWESTTQPINAGSAKFGLQKKTEPILIYSKNKSNVPGFNVEEVNGDLSYPHIGKLGPCRFEIIEKSDAGSYNRPTMKFQILGQYPREGKRWQIGEDTARLLEKEGKVEIVDGVVKKAIYPEDELDKIQFKPFWSLFSAAEYGTAQTGKDELNTIMGTPVGFDTVKSISLIKKLLFHMGKEYTVLDFFSGSATTAHAVMQLNSEDVGNRKFIMVQLPEETGENGDAYRAGYKDICELGKERIRRAGEKIKQEIEAANAQLKIGEEPRRVTDIGFKVFRTADTNIKWNLYDALGQLDTSAMTHTSDLADFTMGFSDIDVVYEVMLRQKDAPLSSTFETLTGIGSRTYLYGSAYLVCLETEITENLIDKLAALDPLPIKFIFRDSAFKDDINLKDETFRRLKNLIERNSGLAKKTYTVEFI